MTRHPLRAWALVGALVGAVTIGSACGTPAVDAGCAGVLRSTGVGPLADPALAELSGIVAGAANPGVLWAHNDSGDTSRVFALGANGTTLGAYTLSGATAVDWEDIARGPGPVAARSYLYVGDIGDNALNRPEIVVYRVPEPTVSGTPGAQTVTGVDALHLRYPDGAHDAEALVVDPRSGELFVIVKHLAGGTAATYRAPAGLAGGSVTTLRRVTDLSLGAGLANAVTGADVSSDGNEVAVRTYGSVLLWKRPSGQPLWKAFATAPCHGPPPSEVQGEAIGFLVGGRGYATVGEGADPTLHEFTAP